MSIKMMLPILFFFLFHFSHAQDTTAVVQTKPKQSKPLKEKIYYSFQNQYIIFLIDWFKERSPFGWGRAVDVMIGLFRP